MSRQSFVYGALVLLVAGLLNRIIGFIYQILMIRLITPEGIGLFNMVYPIYVLVLVVASAGIPLAVSKLVAEEMARNNVSGAYRIFRISFGYLVLFSVLCTVGLILGSPILLKYFFTNPKVYYSFLCLIPGVIIVSLCSAFRGFFQGLQQMTPTAVTQTLEQLVRVTAGLTAAYIMLPKGLEYAAIGVSLGVVCGELVGFLSMLFIYFRHHPHVPSGYKTIRVDSFGNTSRRIFNLAIPITLTRFVATALISLEAILIPQRLQAVGFPLGQATSIYGQLSGIAETLLFTPTIITISLATALVPAISDALAQNNIPMVHNRIGKALRITILSGLPSAIILMILAKEICSLLFNYPDAGIILKYIAIGGPFLYFTQTTTGILQGLGNASRPLKNMFIASVFKVIGIYYLTVFWGIRGTAISLAVSYLIMAFMNGKDLMDLTGYKFNFKIHLIKPFIAVIGMGLVLFQVNNFFYSHHILNFFSLIITMLAGLVVYFALLFVTKTMDYDDLVQLFKILKIKK